MKEQANTTQRELVAEWASMTIEYLQKALDKNNVSKARMNLFDSFLQEMVASGDEVTELVLKFNFYIRYLDMGVGNGVPIGSQRMKADFLKNRNHRGQLHRYARRKIPVYNKPVTHRVKTLSTLLANNYGIKAIQALEMDIKQVDIKI